MGLTARQAEEAIYPISIAYDRMVQGRAEEARVNHLLIMHKWETDPRVRTVQTMIEAALGQSWDNGYSSPKSVFWNMLTSEWEIYESGARTSSLANALKDAGYEKIDYQSFSRTPAHAQLVVALRTTKKHWGDIALPFSSLVVSTTVATNEEQIVEACNEFLKELM